MKIKSIIAKILDLPNAYKVLEIMDMAGCDIEEIEPYSDKYRIKPKWYVTKQEAEDLQNIDLHQHNYKKVNKLWYKLFRTREGYRFLYYYR